LESEIRAAFNFKRGLAENLPAMTVMVAVPAMPVVMLCLGGCHSADKCDQREH
jgi:hypothetical protein